MGCMGDIMDKLREIFEEKMKKIDDSVAWDEGDLDMGKLTIEEANLERGKLINQFQKDIK